MVALTNSNSTGNGRGVPTVVDRPTLYGPNGSVILLGIANVADELPPWGLPHLYQRDKLLREFWPQESMLAGAVGQVTGKYAGFGYTLEGPLRQIHYYQNMLQACEHGEGWIALNQKLALDYLVCDNGCFGEIIRQEPGGPTDVAVQLNHLDSTRCWRTGNWLKPVIYRDLANDYHELNYWEVFGLTELPSAVEEHKGIQVSAVSRVFAAAQEMRDIGTYNREKLSGLDPKALHLVAGIGQSSIEDAMKLARTDATNRGRTRYVPPVIANSIEPLARISHEVIEFASLPEGFDRDQFMRWYIDFLAICLGQDPQDFAPLPGGNLGTAQQSQVLAQKGRGKGSALWMKKMEVMLNRTGGVIPRTVKFSYGQQDSAEDELRTMLQWRRAQMYKLYWEIGTDPRVLRQMMRDNGDLRPEYLELIGETDITPETKIADSFKEYKRYQQDRGDWGIIKWAEAA